MDCMHLALHKLCCNITCINFTTHSFLTIYLVTKLQTYTEDGVFKALLDPRLQAETALWHWLGLYVSISVCQFTIFLKSDPRIFLKFYKELAGLKGQ